MTAAYQNLITELDEVRRQWRARAVLSGVLLALALGLGVLGLTVLADNLLKLSVGGRVVLALVLWAAVGGSLAWFAGRRWRDQRRDDFFAALVEQKHPELHNHLINALQLGRAGAGAIGSPRLVNAIVDDAATATTELDWEDCLDTGGIKRGGQALGIVLVCLALYPGLFAPRFVNGLGRVLLPVAAIPAYSETQIVEDSVRPGHARVPEGAAIRFEAQVAGQWPDTARLMRRADGGRWQPVKMQRDGTDGFAASVTTTTESFDYYIAAGDGRSQSYRVEVVRRPRIEQITVGYQLPPYTGRPATDPVESDGALAGLPGTTVRLTVTASKPLQQASLVTENGVVALEETGDGDAGMAWQGEFVIWSADAQVKAAPEAIAALAGRRLMAPARYHVRLLDTDGYEMAEPVWRPITLLRDQSPSVAFLAPARDLQLKPDQTLPLAIEARDDYGIGEGRILYRRNEDDRPVVLAEFSADALTGSSSGPTPLAGARSYPKSFTHDWDLAATGLKPGDLVQYWAAVTDRNNITGPGRAESRKYTLYVVDLSDRAVRAELQMGDYAQVLEELVRLQRENRAQTASGVAFPTLITREAKIRRLTGKLARSMEQGMMPLATMVAALDDLAADPMAEVIRLLESDQRDLSLPVQDRIITELQALLARLQRNEQARKELRRLEKTDKPAHDKLAEVLSKMMKEIDELLGEGREISGKFEKFPKRDVEDYSDEALEAMKDLEQFEKRMRDWIEGSVDELAKLPTGFVDDFGLRDDFKRIFEEIEMAAERKAATKVEVAIEDIADPLGEDLLTRMKEDLDTWMPDKPDSLQWILEEPYIQMEMPEMALPESLQDLMGELMQEEEEFDAEAEDQTSGWGLNLDQAGWEATDGPWSNFSAKGITGNDLPNTNELTGRSGDGRRGKASGQMVGDTSRALDGRQTPARVGAERYEPGKLKQEGQDDPQGATGGGKKAGASQQGLQGNTPPDFVKDMERLSKRQQNIREKAEKLARKLELAGVPSRRLDQGIVLMKSIEQDYRDLRYEDAARRRRVALTTLQRAQDEMLDPAGVQLSRARQIPAAMRDEILQASDEGYPPGYEDMLKSYFRALSEGE